MIFLKMALLSAASLYLLDITCKLINCPISITKMTPIMICMMPPRLELYNAMNYLLSFLLLVMSSGNNIKSMLIKLVAVTFPIK